MNDRIRITELAELELIERVRDLEHAIASCLLRDPAGTLRLTHAAGLQWPHFTFDPYVWCMRGAIAAVDSGDYRALTPPFMLKLVHRLRDQREQSERLELFWLFMEAPSHLPTLGESVRTLARIAKQLDASRRHRAAARLATCAAWRAAFGESTDEDLHPRAVVARQAKPVAVASRELPAARPLRAVGVGAGVDARRDRGGADRGGEERGMDASGGQSRWKKRIA